MQEEKLEKLQERARDARLVNLADHLIFPFIVEMKEQQLNRMLWKFQKGEKDFLSEVAYVQAIEDLRIFLGGKQTKGEKAFAELEKAKT